MGTAFKPSITQVARYFVTYSGVKLPLQLMNELTTDSLKNRNTYFRAWFDANTRLQFFEKVTYDEIELSHCYTYHPNGALKRAQIVNADDEVTTLAFDERGTLLSSETDTA